ncbi:hypothetical protein [Frigoriglobus tundricola]|uniref:Uncharacterized protein n=1 Tax=Frigoriglobus tundricola TaxID=2774151 RepID=A0A6M5YUX2_9BACT|nr:hypothetical protein [Frigoriglobus tundricola]QJW97244.1 hypothetical protein FTUN_4814 [Frigoriglobus tundricola]
MKNEDGIMIRYMGADHARRFVLQRGDDKYWTGDGWSKILDTAKIFTAYRQAQKEYATLQYQKHRGKAVRTFKVEATVTLVADEVETISPAALVVYLAEALRLDIDNSIFGDGPVPGSLVKARLWLKTLTETEPRRKVF